MCVLHCKQIAMKHTHQMEKTGLTKETFGLVIGIYI